MIWISLNFESVARENAIVRESCEVALDIHEYWADAHNFDAVDQFEQQ
jgi:hypothetical protein